MAHPNLTTVVVAAASTEEPAMLGQPLSSCLSGGAAVHQHLMQSIAILTTYPSSELAASVAKKLLESGLVACVNLIPAVRSMYRWKGEIADDSEVLAIAKTTMALFESVREMICELHSYECPEVIALPIEAGHTPYLNWIVESVTGGGVSDSAEPDVNETT